MESEIKFAHINLIAFDWKKLAEFYIQVFGCKPVYPERNLTGDFIDKLTQIENVEIQGIHLQLPGFQNGPTLEIFSYNIFDLNAGKRINKPGFGHIAFLVDDVDEILEKLLSNGGQKYGDKIQTKIEDVGNLTVIYATDPEENIIEIQHWSKIM